MVLSLSVSESPLTDLSTHTLYLTPSAVYLLPLRRVLQNDREIHESVILLHHLEPQSREVLLRVKHVALNFNSDFSGSPNIVPGSRFIGKLATKTAFHDSDKRFELSDKLFVFPVSACWIQSPENCCPNCKEVQMRAKLSSYSLHNQYPCSKEWVYGRTIDGGLQDYVKVLHPAHSLIKIPKTVSLHDCSFLSDIALPFYAFCRETLLLLVSSQPSANILVVLPDANTHANDCLLVIHHLQMESLQVTFTDPQRLKASPELARSYRHSFCHVCVFATGPEAIALSIDLAVSSGLLATRSFHTINLFGENANVKMPHFDDKTIHRVTLSYKDKFLMEELLNALAEYNKLDSNDTGSYISADSVSSNETIQVAGSAAMDLCNLLLPMNNGSTLLKEGSIPGLPRPAKRNMLWLHCDNDYRLCPVDPEGSHDSQAKHQTSNDINRLLKETKRPSRIFYTNKPYSHEKVNAFIFST